MSRLLPSTKSPKPTGSGKTRPVLRAERDCWQKLLCFAPPYCSATPAHLTSPPPRRNSTKCTRSTLPTDNDKRTEPHRYKDSQPQRKYRGKAIRTHRTGRKMRGRREEELGVGRLDSRKENTVERQYKHIEYGGR